MKECLEHVIKVGFHRNPRKVFDEIETVSADMIRKGWTLANTCMEDGLVQVHLMFERIVDTADEGDTTGLRR